MCVCSCQKDVTKGGCGGWKASVRVVSAHERNTNDGVKHKCIRWGASTDGMAYIPRHVDTM